MLRRADARLSGPPPETGHRAFRSPAGPDYRAAGLDRPTRLPIRWRLLLSLAHHGFAVSETTGTPVIGRLDGAAVVCMRCAIVALTARIFAIAYRVVASSCAGMILSSSGVIRAGRSRCRFPPPTHQESYPHDPIFFDYPRPANIRYFDFSSCRAQHCTRPLAPAAPRGAHQCQRSVLGADHRPQQLCKGTGCLSCNRFPESL